MSLSAVTVGPGYGINGSLGAYDDVTLVGGDMGFVEIEPGYVVNGAYPDYGPMYGAGMGAYDDVTLVGDFGLLPEKGIWSRNMLLGTAAGLLATAATAYLLGKAMAFK